MSYEIENWDYDGRDSWDYDDDYSSDFSCDGTCYGSDFDEDEDDDGPPRLEPRRLHPPQPPVLVPGEEVRVELEEDEDDDEEDDYEQEEEEEEEDEEEEEGTDTDADIEAAVPPPPPPFPMSPAPFPSISPHWRFIPLIGHTSSTGSGHRHSRDEEDLEEMVVRAGGSRGPLSRVPVPLSQPQPREIVGGRESDSIAVTDCSDNTEFHKGPICPICFDRWTGEGEHSLCCLPCGHLYGLSCIEKWLQRSNGQKCPQCNKPCKLEDVRRLYGAPLSCTVDEEMQQTIKLLEAKCAALELKEAEWARKEAEWHQKEAFLHQQLNQLKEAAE